MFKLTPEGRQQSQRQHCVAKGVARRGASSWEYILLCVQMVTYWLLEVLKNGFVDSADAVVDESMTEQHSENTYPHVVVIVALSTEQHRAIPIYWKTTMVVIWY